MPKSLQNEDKRKKAKVEMRNSADSVVYQTRKMIDENEEKLADEDTKPVSREAGRT